MKRIARAQRVDGIDPERRHVPNGCAVEPVNAVGSGRHCDKTAGRRAKAAQSFRQAALAGIAHAREPILPGKGERRGVGVETIAVDRYEGEINLKPDNVMLATDESGAIERILERPAEGIALIRKFGNLGAQAAGSATEPGVAPHMDGKSVVKSVVVPNKLVNLVVK